MTLTECINRFTPDQLILIMLVLALGLLIALGRDSYIVTALVAVVSYYIGEQRGVAAAQK